MQNQHLSPSDIIAAFQIIITNASSQEQIKQADNYLRQCQSNPQFCITFNAYFASTENKNTQWQVLILLSNVMKRNWTTKRRVHDVCCLSEDNKNQIKNGIVELYKQFWSGFSKEFNQMFKFLAKYEFPSNYPSLKSFITQILSSLAKSDIQAVMAPQELLPYLSLVKCIFKQNSNRRFLHSKQSFKQHIQQPLNLSVSISQKINTALISIQNIEQSQIDTQIWEKLFQCSRKIDKIILYCLQCCVSTMQNDHQISSIIENLVNKMQLLTNLKSSKLKQQIQLNILAILQGTSKLQITLPFLFTNFLSQYLQIIISLLFTYVNQSQNSKLIHCILISNSKPLTTFAYYSTPNQFHQSIQCKKGQGSIYIAQQQICYNQFIQIYSGNNCINFLQKIMSQIMVKFKESENEQQNQSMFEDGDGYQDSVGEYSNKDLLLILIKNLISKFKEQFKIFISQIFDHLLNNKLPSTTSKIILNMYEIILLLPKIYDQPNLSLDKISQLLQLSFLTQDYRMFAKIIRHYNSYLNMTMISKSFQILINIVSQQAINHQIIYQCAVCIKKMLSQHEQDELPLTQIGKCLTNLLNLVKIYKNIPSHLWSILQLITQLLKIISNQTIIQNLNCIIQNTKILIQMKDNQQLTIQAISDLLQNVLDIITPQTQNLQNLPILQSLYEVAIQLIGINVCNRKIESPQFLYKLWLSVVRNIHISKNSQNLIQKLTHALQNLQDHLLQQDPIILLELTQEYLLGGLITLTPENIIEMVGAIIEKVSEQHKNRTLMALFSLYFTYYLTTNKLIPKILILAIQTVCQLQNKISQNNNLLRTFIMLIINHHIISNSTQQIFEIFNSAFNHNYQKWFAPFIWSLQYLNHKYACKIASIAMLSSIDILIQSQILLQPIDDCLPLEKLMKSISFQVQPITLISATNSYMNTFKLMLQPNDKRNKPSHVYYAINNTPRKYKLHIKSEWAQCDLTLMYKEKFCPILAGLGWNLETLQQKFDRLTSNRIGALLNGVKSE